MDCSFKLKGRIIKLLIIDIGKYLHYFGIGKHFLKVEKNLSHRKIDLKNKDFYSLKATIERVKIQSKT